MTVADVENLVARVAELGDSDPESAHSHEDRLYEAVLTAIATGAGAASPAALCVAALQTKRLNFPRWCA